MVAAVAATGTSRPVLKVDRGSRVKGWHGHGHGHDHGHGLDPPGGNTGLYLQYLNSTGKDLFMGIMTVNIGVI